MFKLLKWNKSDFSEISQGAEQRNQNISKVHMPLNSVEWKPLWNRNLRYEINLHRDIVRENNTTYSRHIVPTEAIINNEHGYMTVLCENSSNYTQP